ncbi:MAG: quinoprotein glucose dehydrogenase [Parcubacteria group bacterium Gr01-1014_48]|nr:MAG: quinoprotein glucose dehydrogenase [Parcubacteria group bacterium Greene0416_14]TSC74409.1 MAG: quinoprotein glucose dehydrogenase [Parcubacteria group bacterium Gr01-1014_48]TSD01263.1 MAG: quinoprotein glucose dehydrogenase [Parcubacteria group bacterium Greene1014_15]TSD08416.1 MAG: quinoprotein glucose dehydrogenase [Parcubacteria group bacterium Greene0714_4]
MKSKVIILLIGILVIVVAGYVSITKPETPGESEQSGTAENTATTTEVTPPVVPPSVSPVTIDTSLLPATEVIAENLDIPWDIAFLPDGSMLVSERPGNLFVFAQDGSRKAIDVPDVRHVGEGGLLGMTLHPNFKQNKFIYLYVTVDQDGELLNRVIRYRLDNNVLSNKEVILSDIPGAQFHDGGRMGFSPDGFLFITTGDARDEKLAQDKTSLAGKILRIREDGSIPADNPFGNEVYSYGHRNPQGITWDDQGQLWSTEHGRTTATLTGMDELNLIGKGKNYGWPDIEGDKTKQGMEVPVLHSGASETWAPASAAFLDGSIYFGGLRGETLYRAKITGERSVELARFLHTEFGRIRVVRVGPDKMLYISTSNQDGRGTARKGDDKIIRVNPAKLDL